MHLDVPFKLAWRWLCPSPAVSSSLWVTNNSISLLRCRTGITESNERHRSLLQFNTLKSYALEVTVIIPHHHPWRDPRLMWLHSERQRTKFRNFALRWNSIYSKANQVITVSSNAVDLWVRCSFVLLPMVTKRLTITLSMEVIGLKDKNNH